MDYQGYKLIDKIMLVCRDKADREESTAVHTVRKDYQAYLVDPANKKQLESARYWAKWTEYGPSVKNEKTGRWEREYEIEHPPVEFEFDNNGFELELLDCAGGSSQGGKLSFWNCVVTKDNNRFVIGINSDMLLNLLKNATFVGGKCQSPLIFITQKGKVGMTVEGSETYKQCIKDKELMNALKKTQTSKFTFGDKVSTATISEVYLGTINRYYVFNPGEENIGYHWSTWDIRRCTLTRLKKPVTYHMFERLYQDKTLVDIINCWDGSYYSYPDLKNKCPKRTITGSIEKDCTEAEFKQRLVDKIYDYDAFINYAKNNYSYQHMDEKRLLYYFLGRSMFGYNFESFELDAEVMALIKKYGIKYVEE